MSGEAMRPMFCCIGLTNVGTLFVINLFQLENIVSKNNCSPLSGVFLISTDRQRWMFTNNADGSCHGHNFKDILRLENPRLCITVVPARGHDFIQARRALLDSLLQPAT